MNRALYIASHTHVCGNIGGFPEQNPRVSKFATAYTLAPPDRRSTDVTNTQLPRPAAPVAAALVPRPGHRHATPGQYQAGWSVTGNGQYLVYGGEFPG